MKLPPCFGLILMSLFIGIPATSIQADPPPFEVEVGTRLPTEEGLYKNADKSDISLAVNTYAKGVAEGYTLIVKASTARIQSIDEKGAMYALFDTTERILNGDSFDEIELNKTIAPRFPLRAVKFNLPFMSYRVGESLASNYETCRDLAFWRDYLDMLARNRFNTLALWSLHPFHYMIRPKNFPEAVAWSEQELEP